MVGDKQFVFLIGAARSGTTWLQALLAAHPSVCTTAELMLFNFYTFPWEKAWKEQLTLQEYGGSLGLPIFWTEDEFTEFLKDFLFRTYERVSMTKPGATILLDKHPGYAECVEHINRLIPNAKFLNIVRDGRDVAVSYLAASQGWGSLWAPSEVGKAARKWKQLVRDGQKAREYGDRYMEISYEELLANGPQVLVSVFNFLGLSVDLKTATSIYQDHHFEIMKKKSTGGGDFALPKEFFRKGKQGDWETNLTPLQKLSFHDIAGDLLCELGYAKDSWWWQNTYERFSVPLFAKLRKQRFFSKIIKSLANEKLVRRLKEVF